MFLRILVIMIVVETLVMGICWLLRTPQGMIAVVSDAVLLAAISCWLSAVIPLKGITSAARFRPRSLPAG